MRERRTVSVVVPPGVDTHHQLKVAGQGDAGRKGGAAGDIRVRLNIAPHPQFTRDGNDVHVSVGVPLSTAVLGGSVTVPTLTGEAVLKVDAGTQPGDRRVMRGKGIRDVSGRGGLQGSQYVTFNVRVPTDLTQQQRQTFETFAAQRGEATNTADGAEGTGPANTESSTSTGSGSRGGSSTGSSNRSGSAGGSGGGSAPSANDTADSDSSSSSSSTSSSSSSGFFSSLFGNSSKDGKAEQSSNGQQTKKQTAGGGGGSGTS